MISNNCYIKTDTHLTIVEVNSHTQTLFGLPHQQLIGQSIKNFLNDIDTKACRNFANFNGKMLEVISSQVANGFAFMFVKATNNPLFSDEVDFVEQALEVSEIGIWSYDHVKKEFTCNSTFRKLLDFPLNSSVSLNSLLQLVHEDDRELFLLFFEHHLQFQIPLQFEFRTDSKQQKWLSLKGEYVNNSHTQNIVGTIVDSSYERQMVIALNEANESKQLAIEAGKIGTWNGRLESGVWRWQWDNQANDIFKMNAEDIGNLDKWIECLHPEDKDNVVKDLEHSLVTGKEFISTYRSTLQTGELIYIFAQGRVGKDIHGENYRIDGVCIDQTRFYQAQKELQQLNVELEERVKGRTHELNAALSKAERASEVKSNFLAMMSHELRTPLNGIIGSLDLLKRCKLEHDSFELVNIASTSANSLITILNDVLDINKIEAGKLEINHTVFDLAEVIHEVVTTFAAKAKEKHIHLNISESTLPENYVLGDDNRLRQILLNLVGNAIKFTGDKDAKHSFVNIDVSTIPINDYQIECTISVSDSGIGIRSDVIDKLFTPFTQAEKSTTRQFGGTGLGLAICGKLIDLMGGQIKVSSELGKGSVFKIIIPFWIEKKQTIEILDLPLQVVNIGESNEFSEYFCQLLQSIVNKSSQQQITEKNQLATISKNIRTVFVVSNVSLFKQYSDSLDEFLHVDIFTTAFNREAVEIVCPHLVVNQIQPVTSYGLKHILLDTDEDLLLEDVLPFISGPSQLEDLDSSNHDILLVEDNPFNQKLVKRQLQSLGLDCDIADNGEQGYQIWKTQQYKMILTDCHMPILDGYGMTKRIRSKEVQLGIKSIPIIAVTGATMNDDVKYCKSIGMDDFLSKPIKLNEIKQVVEKWYA
ncbi:ATP-binding protein [Pseudoalteromonas spongiae]|uniref:ATP-binding protein n=1 Tax=Pseudoalteromonas spongiae TaxID=298657 RepID=UPI0037358706